MDGIARGKDWSQHPVSQGRVVRTRVRGKFELRYESLKNKFSLIRFAYNLVIGYSKNNIENYPKECKI